MSVGPKKGAIDKPARQARPRTCDTTTMGLADAKARNAAKSASTPPADEKPRSKYHPLKPRATPKRSLMSAILRDPRLDADDRAAIEQANADGLTVQEAAAFAVYQVALAQKLFANKQIEGKDVIVAMNRIGSSVTACAQLSTAGGPSAATVTIKFEGKGQTADREGAVVSTPDPDIGDVIVTE